MKEMSFTDAKARLSSVVDDAVEGRPTLITRHGRKEAVVVSVEEWRKRGGAPSFWSLLLSAPIEADDIPERDRRPMRDVDF